MPTRWPASLEHLLKGAAEAASPFAAALPLPSEPPFHTWRLDATPDAGGDHPSLRLLALDHGQSWLPTLSMLSQRAETVAATATHSPPEHGASMAQSWRRLVNLIVTAFRAPSIPPISPKKVCTTPCVRGGGRK